MTKRRRDPLADLDPALRRELRELEQIPALKGSVRDIIRDTVRQARAARTKILIDELSPSMISRIEERMRPGAYSREGFLDDTQSLVSVIEQDARTLSDLSVSHEEIADRLEDLLCKAMGQSAATSHVASGAAYVEGGRFEIYWDTPYFGEQTCPFLSALDEDCGASQYGGLECVIRNVSQRDGIGFSGLLVHLVRCHHFFEGTRAHRLDPAAAVRVLQLAPSG